MADTAEAPVRAARRPRVIEKGRRVEFGEPAYFKIMDFLIQEARMLDEDRLGDWLKLLASDIFYYMSQRRTLARGQNQVDTGSYWYYENIETLDWRVQKFLQAKSNFAEDPPSRYRRYVSNLTLFETQTPGEFIAQSYVLLMRNRGAAPDYQQVSCVREDCLRVVDGGFQVAQRHIVLDQAVLGTHNISFFL